MTNYEHLMSQMTSDLLADIINDYFWGECRPDCPVITGCMKEYTCRDNIKRWLDSEFKKKGKKSK